MVNKHPEINGMPCYDDNNCYFITACLPLILLVNNLRHESELMDYIAYHINWHPLSASLAYFLVMNALSCPYD